MIVALSKFKNLEDQSAYLKDNNMALYALLCKKTGNIKEYKRIMEQAKLCRESFMRYTEYATVFLPVKFYELVQAGAITDGQKEIKIGGKTG